MKKTMKKSALLSALAMLIVSAIVLTSATYAWFSASTQATVAELGSSVQTASGLLVSIDGGQTWKANITTADLTAAGITSKQLSPVSTANGSVFVGGALDDTGVLKLDVTTSGFYQFDLWIKSGATSDVMLTNTTFDTSTNAKKALRLALYDVDAGNWSETGVISADGSTDTYKGIGAKNDYTSTSGDALIVDDGTSITPKAVTNAKINLLANTPKHYKVLVWLEGNDPDCSAELMSGVSTSFSLAFSLPA